MALFLKLKENKLENSKIEKTTIFLKELGKTEWKNLKFQKIEDKDKDKPLEYKWKPYFEEKWSSSHILIDSTKKKIALQLNIDTNDQSHYLENKLTQSTCQKIISQLIEIFEPEWYYTDINPVYYIEYKFGRLKHITDQAKIKESGSK